MWVQAILRRLPWFLLLGSGWLQANQQVPLTAREVAILEGRNRSEAGCKSRLQSPEIDFHFRFTGGVRLWISSTAMGFSEPDAAGQLPDRRPLTLISRIVSLESQESPAFLRRSLSIRRESIDRNRVGLAFQFHIGPGKYRLDWMLETASGEVCSGRLSTEVGTNRASREIRPALEPGQSYFSGQSPPVPWWYQERRPGGYHLKLVLNVPPFKEGRSLVGADLSRIEAILTRLAFHPRVGRVSLVVFNLKDQRVLYRQDGGMGLPDPQELADAIRSLSNSQIRVETLEKNSDSRFLGNLLIRELSESQTYDAVVLLGPRAPLPLDIAAVVSEIQDAAPVYYLKYRFYEAGAGWSDPLQKVTRQLGGRTFPVQRPKDLWNSVEELIGSISRPR